ncbi:uncharacterized protein LOC110458339 isoform X2 [Mizuhopecten yessoensis]|uniref:uncharacterized protein LOC110458339 isoform X2 n=1 Tax=Mizuhopecten yessoensis TaxID=6573 RepID=UPI000B45B7D5|nr:uncharacterized protein LOC110458339 isoform X2 [Mizuhopecten yessoensis]
MVKSDVPNDGYPMDTWEKSTTPNMTSQTQLPANGLKRGFRKPQNKFRWYIIIGISVLMTLVVVVVISLAIHFTSNANNPDAWATDQPDAVTTLMTSGDDVTTSSVPQDITTSDPGAVTPNSLTLSTITTPSNPRLTLMASDLTVQRKKLTLTCEAINVAGWSDLHIIRHDADVKETVGIVTAGFQYPSVSVLDPDFSSQISYKNDAVAFVLESDIPYCSGVTNYSCIVRAVPGTFTAVTEVKVKQLEPSVIVPKSVVAEKNITLQCSAEIHGQSGTIKWKIRPPGMQSFYDLSTSPVTSQTFSNCSTSINSTLIFVPKTSDNGSHFRCVVEGSDGAIEKADYPKTDVEFNVIPDTFCADKAVYTIHTHPYSPCNLVIYCFQTGPLVYEINCDPGTCYDKDNTKCI